MKTLKKTLCLVLAVVMAVGVLVLPASAAGYTDVASDNDYATAINTLTAYGILKGKSTTEQVFDPSGKVTRAEVAAIAYRILTGDTSDTKVGNYVDYTKVFKDSFATWQKGYVGLCANDGIIYGKGDGYYKPDDNVTGYELLAIMLRAIGYGKNGEFQGANWQKNTLYQAEQLNMLKGVKYDMAEALTREVVAQIVYNAIKAPRVTYVNGTYSFVKDPRDPASNVNIPLVQEASVVVTGEQDVWGIPTNYSTSTTITFTNPAISVPVKEIGKTNTYPAYSTFDAITECNLIKALGDDGDHWAITYTNGKYNQNTIKIEALDTTHKLGHEGRHTLVYKTPGFTGVESEKNPKYTIVYIDTFLAVVTKTWNETLDPAGHVIRKAGADVTVYSNDWPDQFGIKTSGSRAYLTVDGNYTVGQKLGVNVVTVSKLKSGATAPYYAATSYDVFNSMVEYLTPNKSYTAVKDSNGKDSWPGGAQIVADPTVATSPYVLTKATVTIDTVTLDTIDMGAMKNKYSVGFTSAGKQYFYNNTFAGTPVDNTDIGKTFDVWLDSEGNVLDYALSTVSAGYGVTRNVVLKQINSKAWVLSYTILLPDGTETTIDVGDPDDAGKAFTTERDAKQYARDVAEDNLVHYMNSLNYYYFDQDLRIQTTAVAVESGRADAVTRTYNTDANCITGTWPGVPDESGWGVDDNTVFFVAQYLPDLTTNTPDDWVFTGYKIYNGFKNILDLYREDTTIKVQAFDVDANGNPIHASIDAPAKYVLVLDATMQIDPPKYVNEINYAYLITKDVHTQVGANTYTYTAVIDGQITTLTVALNRGASINETGLYSFAQSVNGEGYAQVYRLDGNLNNNVNMRDPYKRNFEIGRGTYRYENGVLYTDTGSATWNYTVDDNCKVYLVNETTGTVLERDLSALDIYGNVSSIWYQLNEKGYIDLIYIEEQPISSGDGMVNDPTTPPTKNYTVTLTKDPTIPDEDSIGMPVAADCVATVTAGKGHDFENIFLKPGASYQFGVRLVKGSADISYERTSIDAGYGKIYYRVKVTNVQADTEVQVFCFDKTANPINVTGDTYIFDIESAQKFQVTPGSTLHVLEGCAGTITSYGKVDIKKDLEGGAKLIVAAGATADIGGDSHGTIMSNGTTTVTGNADGAIGVYNGKTTIDGNVLSVDPTATVVVTGGTLSVGGSVGNGTKTTKITVTPKNDTVKSAAVEIGEDLNKAASIEVTAQISGEKTAVTVKGVVYGTIDAVTAGGTGVYGKNADNTITVGSIAAGAHVTGRKSSITVNGTSAGVLILYSADATVVGDLLATSYTSFDGDSTTSLTINDVKAGAQLAATGTGKLTVNGVIEKNVKFTGTAVPTTTNTGKTKYADEDIEVTGAIADASKAVGVVVKVAASVTAPTTSDTLSESVSAGDFILTFAYEGMTHGEHYKVDIVADDGTVADSDMTHTLSAISGTNTYVIKSTKVTSGTHYNVTVTVDGETVCVAGFTA